MSGTLATPTLQSARILIVEDDELTARGLQQLLTTQGCEQVLHCPDGEAAIHSFDEFAPDLVLLDWHMNGMNGHGFLKSLVARDSEEEIPPVIVLTGDTAPDTRRVALEAGALDFVTKPFDRFEVTARIRNHLRLRQLHRRVQSENQRLEDLVHARTAKLRETIEELRETQQQLIAEERMRALSVMAGGVVHDFNNTLMVIRGYSDLYSRPLTRRQPTTDDMQKAFGTISSAAEEASEIVRRLREFYRPVSDQDAQRRLTDLNRLVHDAIELASPRWKVQCQAHGLSIIIDTHLQELPEVSLIPLEIREVLVSLIFNAVDAMPQGGHITIRTRQDGEEVIIEVEDTGTGMTPETRDRCLEPFYSTKRERGRGLGLAIAYGIVQRHGGVIKVRSELNFGSCFALYLPVRSEEDALPDNVLNLPIIRHLRVLVVDDEPHVRSLVAHYLEEDEHSVTLAASGSDALEKFNSGEFDLVITDRVMPKMSGDQLASAVRKVEPKTPIILLTAYEADGASDDVDLLVRKPSSLGTLREAISRVIATRRGIFMF